MAKAKEKTATDLLEHLRQTGTPEKTLLPHLTWAKQESATAEDLYRRLEEAQVNEGTLRKAGKFVFGAEFEPAAAVLLAPADELLRLRGENESLKNQLAASQADRLGLTNRVKYLTDRMEELTQQVSFLKVGRSPEDLALLGAGESSH